MKCTKSAGIFMPETFCGKVNYSSVAESIIMSKTQVVLLLCIGFITADVSLAYNGDEADVNGRYSSSQFNKNNKPTALDKAIAGFTGNGEGVANGGYVNPFFKGWATGYVNYNPASGSVLYPQWQQPDLALGAVTGNNSHIVSLGDRSANDIANGIAPGEITLTFQTKISNGNGADFAVFENGFISAGGAGVDGEIFAELSFVEVSSNGVDFIRFPSVSLTGDAVGPYGTVDPGNVYNLAGKHVNAYGSSWGTPFDLDSLKNHSQVLNGTVDLNNIGYVKVVDITGNGSQFDSQGNPIYDAWQTWGSGGTDLEAIGVIRHIGEAQIGTIGADNGQGHIGWGWNGSKGSVRINYAGLQSQTEFNVSVFDGDELKLLSSSGVVLHAWNFDFDDAGFSEDGQVDFEAFISKLDYDTADDLTVFVWNGNSWDEVEIDNFDDSLGLIQIDNIMANSIYAVTSTPEPATLAIFSLSAIGLLLNRKRKTGN